MKRIIAITFAVILTTLLVFSTSAQAYGGGEDLIPVLNYTLSADGYVIHAPAIKSTGNQSTSVLLGTPDDLSEVGFLAQDVTVAEFENYTEAEAKIYYDFLESNVNGEDFRPGFFDIQYAPFTIRYGDAFQYSNVQTGTTTARLDSYTLFEAIGAAFEWYGGADAYIQADVVFRLNYVKRELADSAHSVYLYQPLTHVYEVSINNEFSNGFYANAVSLDDMTFRSVTDDLNMTFDQFHNDIVSKTGTMRGYYGQNNVDNVYLDVEACNVQISAVNAPFAGLVQPYAPYIDVNGFDYINGLFWNPNEGAYSYRTQHRGAYSSLMASNVLNKQELNNIPFDDSGSPLVRVPALFLSTVGEFFSIDFFGMGFTLGHLTFVVFLASVVLIFLKIFAGG